MASPTLRQIWIALAIPGALAAALLLNRLMVSDKTRVEKVIRSMAEEAGRADVNAIFSHVAADYADDFQGRAGLQAAAEKVFASYGPLRVTIRRMTVNTSGRLASVEVTVSGRGNNRNRNETPGTWVWKIQMRKDSDEAWRVMRATPLQLGETDDIPGWRALNPAVRPQAAAMSLYDEAQKALKEEKWADAAAKYKEFAAKYPSHGMVALALSSAAGIYEQKLNDKQSADELRQRIVAMQEKLAASGPMELCNLAAAYADSGDLEKAIATYRKVLAIEHLAGASNMRLRAQYEIGKLLEKLRRPAEAVEAYKAAAAMPGGSPYCKMLREQAKKKEDAFVAATSK